MAWCFTCQGLGTVECLCGGDLCVCLNHGERDCPACHGFGNDEDDDDYGLADEDYYEANQAPEDVATTRSQSAGEGSVAEGQALPTEQKSQSQG
jgi:hypothetical protein